MDVFKLKEKVANVGAALKSATEELVEKLDNPAVPKEKLDELRNRVTDLEGRFGDLKTQLAKAEEEQRAEIKKSPIIVNEKDKLIQAKATFYRNTLLRQPVPADILNQLQALPAGGGTGGENFLPTQLATELIYEPYFVNNLRNIIRISAVKGLELPKIAFTIGDNEFIIDEDSAKECEVSGDKVSFGRFKSKVIAKIADTVVHGSNLNLVQEVESSLRSGLAYKESQVSFATVQETGAEHMSFYQEESAIPVIQSVTGTTLYKAITNAIAALPEAFRANAKVVMAYADYVTMLQTLANNAVPLYAAQPEQIIGKPVVFCDGATTPIVGDFNYCQLNYDGTPIYDTDKDVEAGNYLFVLTAWFDQQRKLNSAFRLAIVEEESPIA